MDKKVIVDFLTELKQLMDKYSLFIGVDITGDTFGVDCNFIVSNGNEKEIVEFYTSYLTSYDIQLYIGDQ